MVKKTKKTGGGAQQAGSTKSFKKQRDIAFKKMLKALASNDKKEYEKQHDLYDRLSAGYNASMDDTQAELLDLAILEYRNKFSRDYRKGGMVLSTVDNRKKK